MSLLAKWGEQKAELAEVRRVIEWQEKEYQALREITGDTRKLRQMAKRIRKNRKAMEGFEQAIAKFEEKACSGA